MWKIVTTFIKSKIWPSVMKYIIDNMDEIVALIMGHIRRILNKFFEEKSNKFEKKANDYNEEAKNTKKEFDDLKELLRTYEQQSQSQQDALKDDYTNIINELKIKLAELNAKFEAYKKFSEEFRTESRDLNKEKEFLVDELKNATDEVKENATTNTGNIDFNKKFLTNINKNDLKQLSEPNKETSEKDRLLG
ncbi:hypothetical protein [Priestia megaterium]|uniref:hypothetical protein n=1 Tax=Priestia megaterium TaxID=1404 RepID=UPI000BF9C868|nr:hypothetical protein [Priestia megaterium]PFR91310.1 hypothetical protein COK39_22790 [Priestia megaterium]